ncbi:MAG: L,D-transpeptidase family protein, partial [Thiohalocapsa sp.]
MAEAAGHPLTSRGSDVMRRFPLVPISTPAWVLGLLLPIAMVFSLPAASETLQQQADALRDREEPSIADVPLFSGRFLAEFYAEREYTHAWDDARARALLGLARSSRADGFDPEDFHADAIAQVLDSDQLRADSEASRAAADILLSDALLRYVHHFRFGKYNPRMVNSGQIFVDKADAELLKADLERVLAAPDLAAEISALVPDAPFYRNLKLGYQRYLAIADRGGWSDIPAGANLSIGSKSPRVALVRQHLEVIDGYQPSAMADPESFDEGLAAAVKGFQKRSGLGADGVVGPATLRALNQPLDDRLLTIRANLERMRWLYNDLPADYLLVDITAYRLQLLRNHEEVWTTPVVIGTTDAQTPMFRDEMEHIVFNPTWSVPVSIQKKMGGVSSRYQVVDRRTGRKVSGVDTSNYKRYRIVQPAGPSNALGRVKFMFPNGHAIYLHDTPSRHLFSRRERAYSHGCIRVKDPLTLAQQVLNKPNWDQSEINRVVKRGKTRYVHLDDHLPVLLYYLTAVADDQGRVGFRRDVYNRDRRLLAVLDKPAHGDRIAFLEPEPEPELEPATKPEP